MLTRGTREDDTKWPQKNKDGRQELEIRLGSEHISFETAKIGSLVDVNESEDPEGLRVFYYLVQDLKALVFSLISLHFKVRVRLVVLDGAATDYSHRSSLYDTHWHFEYGILYSKGVWRREGLRL